MPPKKKAAVGSHPKSKGSKPKSLLSAKDVSVKDSIVKKFRELDKEGRGTLNFEELRTLLQKGNPKMTDDSIRAVFTATDTNGDDVIEFEEFVEFVFTRDPEVKEQSLREEAELQRIVSRSTSSSAWKRASTDAHVHDRLGAITGAFMFDESGGEGNMSWKEAHRLVLHGADLEYKYELCMFEAMGKKTKIDKAETGVWEISGTKPDIILRNIMGNPPERHLEVTFVKNKVSGVMLQASSPVELRLQTSTETS